jgi:large subunit ribosomal protein L18
MKTQKRRRIENKTDYKRRTNLLKSEKPRILFRKTNRYIIVQYVKSEEAKDRIVFGLTSRKLFDYGWPEKFAGSLKSITASYLIGYLFGKKMKEKKLGDGIMDLGMIRNVHKSKPFACIKGLVDAGVKIECKKDVFQEEGKIKGENLKENFSKYFDIIKSKIDEGKK